MGCVLVVYGYGESQMNYQQMLWFRKIKEREANKKLMEQCGLAEKDACVHEWVAGSFLVRHCKKCGVISDE